MNTTLNNTPAAVTSGEISPNGVYTRRRLAGILVVSVRTIVRMEEEGDLPPSFKLRPRQSRSERGWTGNALLAHVAKPRPRLPRITRDEVLPMRREGLTFTYFIQRERRGPIKIGKTSNITRRLAQMQGGLPEPLVCIAYIEGDRECELQEKFHHLCVCGEWFRDDPELLSFISANATACEISRPLPSPDRARAARELRRRASTAMPLDEILRTAER